MSAEATPSRFAAHKNTQGLCSAFNDGALERIVSANYDYIRGHADYVKPLALLLLQARKELAAHRALQDAVARADSHGNLDDDLADAHDRFMEKVAQL